MKYLIFSLFGLLQLTVLQAQQTQSSSTINDPKLAQEVDALVKAYMDLDIFSGVVLIAEKGNPVYHKAFGLANREKNIPNTLDTRFDIGSMNKGFTKVVILQLVNEGKLSMDDKLGTFLPGFPKEAAEKVTVAHLLNHESGFGGYHTPEYWDIPLEQKSLQTALKQIKKQPLMFEPGTGQEYSNAGYVLLGLIAEKATGKNYYDIVEERIVQPLEMKNTYLREKYSIPNRAIGYYKTMEGKLLNNEGFAEIPTPAGGFYSTTSDMLKFYRAYHYGEELWDEATKSLDGMYNFYQEHITTGGAMTHAGGFEGANTVLFEILRDQISVLVFANMDEVVAENLGAGILAIIRGKQPEAPSLPAEQAVYQAYTEKGMDYVKQNWESLTVNFHPADPKDLILNEIGYTLLQAGQIDKAVQIFKFNTELFPEVGNCWDSYGEGLLKKGDRQGALKAYKKALAINPDIPSAKDAVKHLEKN